MVDINGDTITKSITKSEPRSPKAAQSIFARFGEQDQQPADPNNPPSSKQSSKINVSLFRKIPEDSEAACIFVGYVDGLKNALTEFVRLKEAKLFADVTEVYIIQHKL